MKNKRKTKKNKFKLIIPIFIIVIICIVVFLIKIKPSEEQLEKEMSKLSENYYNERIKGKVIGITNQIITLEALEKAEYNISKFKKCDKKNTQTIITLENPNETNKDKIKYSIKTTMECN